MIDKFKNAFRGLKDDMKDKSIILQIVLGIITFVVCLILRISINDWMIVSLCIGCVIASEVFNSCIERLCDLYTNEINEKVKIIKDMASSGVLIVALSALVVGICLLIKYL